MKNQITFDNTRYHEHPEMYQWCWDNFGVGGWTWATPNTWQGLGDKQWIIFSMFGNTTFAFKDEKHYTLFALRWS